MGLLKRSNGIYYLVVTCGGRQRWLSLRTRRRPSARELVKSEAAFYDDLDAESGKKHRRSLRSVTQVDALIDGFLRSLAGRTDWHIERVDTELRRVSKFVDAISIEGWSVEGIGGYVHAGLTASGWAKGRRKWSNNTANKVVQLVGQFCRWCVEHGHLEADPTAKIKRMRVEKRLPRYLNAEQVRKALDVAAASDVAIERRGGEPWMHMAVWLALETGARWIELCRLEWSHFNEQMSAVTLFGKDHRERIVPLRCKTAAALRKIPRDKRAGYVMQAHTFRGSSRGRSMTEALAAAGVKVEGWRTFRHTYASQLTMAGLGLVELQELMGHSTIEMTRRYSHVSKAHLKAAPELIPY